MKRVFKKITGICLIILFYGCDDVFEEDITDKLISSIYPKEEDVITTNSIHFQWNKVEGADDYRIQIINKDNQELVLDSLLPSHSNLVYGLNNGTYNWRIRGENFAYQTAYSFPISFNVLLSDDLSTQQVLLKSPVSNYYTNESNITLSWNAVFSATSYSLEIDKTVSSNTTTILQESDISDLSYSLNSTLLEEDAKYTWRVKAVNETSETLYATRIIFLDTETPSVPLLVSPAEDALVDPDISFTWSIPADQGEIQSEISSYIEISESDDFSNILDTYSTSELSQDHTFSSAGDYFWRIKTTDVAGNESEFSQERSLTVQ